MQAALSKLRLSQFPSPKKVNNWDVFRTGFMKNREIIKLTSLGVEHANKNNYTIKLFPNEINS